MKITAHYGRLPDTRGIRNNNPFNIRRSDNSWRGKIRISGDKDFEQFISLDYGLRAGFLLLRNAYLNKGYDTPREILYRYAPPKDNNDTSAYLRFIVEDTSLTFDTKISVNSLTFFWFVRKMLLYESRFELSYENFQRIVKTFNLW